MSASLYTDKLTIPQDQSLIDDLGETKKYLDTLARFIEEKYGHYAREWKFYNKKSGWILKMATQKRNVLFIIPCKKHFRVVFTFGEKASDQIFESSLPAHIKNELKTAQKYAEGRSIQLEVCSETDLEYILQLISMKLAW